jgi:hypothetical protein
MLTPPPVVTPPTQRCPRAATATRRPQDGNRVEHVLCLIGNPVPYAKLAPFDDGISNRA